MIVSNNDSEEEDYLMVAAANRQFQRRISQNPQFLDDTAGFHASQNASTSTEKQLDPKNQIAIGIKKLDNKNFQPILFYLKTTTPSLVSSKKQRGSPVEKPSGPKKKII